jgi:hypothetical protein
VGSALVIDLVVLVAALEADVGRHRKIGWLRIVRPLAVAHVGAGRRGSSGLLPLIVRPGAPAVVVERAKPEPAVVQTRRPVVTPHGPAGRDAEDKAPAQPMAWPAAMRAEVWPGHGDAPLDLVGAVPDEGVTLAIIEPGEPPRRVLLQA